MSRKRGLYAVGVAVAGLVLYLGALAPGVYWLDSPELTAAAHTLLPAHPPGHPLYIVLAKALTLLPLGSIATRVSLLSVLAGVAGLLLLFALTLRALRGDDRREDAFAAPAAALAALAFGAAPAAWFQAIRAEVYTLHLALVLAPLLLLAPLAEAAPVPDARRRVVGAAFLVGLGLANHHLLVVLALPALAWLVLANPAGRAALRGRGLVLALGAGLAGLLPYALLPLRGAPEPSLHWGDPATFAGFLEMVTARAYQGSLDPAARASLADNLVTAFTLFLEHLGPLVVLLGLAGLALVVVRRRRLGVALLLLLAGSVLSKALMFLDPTNPDDHGYFAAAMAVLALGAGVTVGAAACALATRLRRPMARAALALGVVAAALGVTGLQIAEHRATCDLRDLRGPDVVTDATLEAVPPEALVLPYYYALHFALAYAQLVEERRPDVSVAHQSFLGSRSGGAAYLEGLRRRAPQWVELAEAEAATGYVPRERIVTRSADAPIYVEPFTELVVPAANLQPLGMLARVRPHPVPSALVRAGRSWRARYWTSLDERLGDEPRRVAHTRGMLLWASYLEAVLHLRRGDAEAAAEALGRGFALDRGAPRLAGLAAWQAHLAAAEADVERLATLATEPTDGATALARPLAFVAWAHAVGTLGRLRAALERADAGQLLAGP